MDSTFKPFKVASNLIGICSVPFLNSIEYLKFKCRLQQLFNEEEKLHDRYNKLIDKAKSAVEKEQLHSEEGSEFFTINDEIDTLVTRFLCSRATQLFVSIPERRNESFWKELYPRSGRYVLTPEGVEKIRASIRKEKKERREPLVTLLPLLIGFIGAICALMTIIKG